MNAVAADKNSFLVRWTPWLVALFSCAALLVSNGVTISGITAFDKALLDAFGWERGEYKFRESITIMFAGIFAPFAGYFLDRYGVRKCMMTGWTLLIVCQFIYPFAQQLYLMYLIHAVFAVVLVVCGLNACVILTSNWVIDGRGKAMGLTLLGSSLGGALITQFNTTALDLFGWEVAFRLGAIFPLILLMLTWLWLKDTPDTALSSPAELTTGAAGAEEGMGYVETLKTLSFWMIALVASTSFFAVLGIQNNLRLHFLDLEFTEQAATLLFALFFFGAMAGKFIFGFLADYFSLRLVFNANIGTMLLGTLLLGTLDTVAIYPALIAFGFGWGGAYTMIQLSVVNLFGLKNAGKILGTITVPDALGGGLGIYAVALFQQQTGDYQFSFYFCAGLIVLAWIAFNLVRFPKRG